MKIPFYKYHANENDFILIFSNHIDKQINISNGSYYEQNKK